MAPARGSSWRRPGPIGTHDLFPSTEARLDEFRHRRGVFTSFMAPRALGVAADCGVTPIGQVVGLSMGEAREGSLPSPTRGGQRRSLLGLPRWGESKARVEAWDAVRRRGLERLSAQAELLQANAVVEISARREETHGMGMVFTGTAVRVADWRRPKDAQPVLTLASAPDLWQLLRAGIEPVGIAGAFACVETAASKSTRRATLARAPNVELRDLTTAVYEARRLAMERLVNDARRLRADGLLDVDLAHLHRSEGRVPGLQTTVHLLGTAIRRVKARGHGPGQPRPVVDLHGARLG
jgi:uncharacterized protein YbjQ (UPF0145 family)